MRIALGEIVQETGTFTRSRTGREAFEAYGIFQGAELLEQLAGVGPPGGFLQVVAERGDAVEVVPLSRAWAGAGPKILDETYDELLEMLLAPLREAGDLDAVFLSLHGWLPSELLNREDDLGELTLHELAEADLHYLDELKVFCHAVTAKRASRYHHALFQRPSR